MKVTTIIIIILSACILYKLLSNKEEGFVLENPNYTSDSNAANNTYGILTDPTNDLNKSNLVPTGYPAGTTNARFSYQRADIKNSNVKTEVEAKNQGDSCPANSPSYFPTTVLFQVPPVNATCATSLSTLYSTSPDSHSVCNINQNNLWFKQGTLNPDTQITSSQSQYGGLTCTEQNTSTKPIQCGPIDAVCTTGDAAYDIPADSTSVCAASSTAPRDFYKTGTRKADTSITTTAAKNSGKTCSTQLAATVTKMCTKVNATPSSPLTLTNGELSDTFYNFNADSFSECNLNKNGLWYKRGTLKQDSAITSSNALYGGLTVTEQINKLGTNLGTKDKLCGAIPAKCRTDADNVISNYTVSSTPMSGSALLDTLGKWVVGPLSECNYGSQTRTVYCKNSSGITVPDGTGNCLLATEPSGTVTGCGFLGDDCTTDNNCQTGSICKNDLCQKA